jgi:carbonic anhydrase
MFPDLGPEAVRAMEHDGVRISLRNLMTFPWVRERVEADRLSLHGAYFAIADGQLCILDPATGEFVPA